MADFDPVSYIMGAKAGSGGGGGGSTTLSGLTDVDISNPSNGQTLVYNASSGKWENGAGPLIIHVNDQGVFDKTWQEIHDCAPLVWVEGSVSGNPAYLPLYMIGTDSDSYFCVFPSAYSNPAMLRANTNTPNGYPVFGEE